MSPENISDLDTNKSSQYFYLQTLSTKSNAFYNSLLAVVLLFVAILPLVHVQVTSSAMASIQPKMLKESVYAPIAGKIVRMNIQNNHIVKNGDTMLTIDNSSVQNEMVINKSKETAISQSIKDLGNILNNTTSFLGTPQYQAQFQNYLEQKKQLEIKLDNVSKTYQRNKSLINDKVISASDFEQVELIYNQAKIELELLLRRFRSQWQTERYQFEQELADLRIKQNQLNELIKKSVVVANSSGTSYVIEGLQPGTYIQGGQKVAEIVPDTGLIAVCLVSPKDIAFIKFGQQVQFQIDSYNFYEWGMAYGTVTEVFKDVDFLDNKPYYIVHCKLNKPFLTLKNNYKGNLIKGMTGKANFVLNKRTLWQLVFTKVNDWFNPKGN